MNTEIEFEKTLYFEKKDLLEKIKTIYLSLPLENTNDYYRVLGSLELLLVLIQEWDTTIKPETIKKYKYLFIPVNVVESHDKIIIKNIINTLKKFNLI